MNLCTTVLGLTIMQLSCTTVLGLTIMQLYCTAVLGLTIMQLSITCIAETLHFCNEPDLCYESHHNMCLNSFIIEMLPILFFKSLELEGLSPKLDKF